MRLIAIVALAAAFSSLACAQGSAMNSQRVTYTKTFPGSDPDYVSITLDHSGMVSYKETPDEDPDTFQLEPRFTDTIFDLAGRLDHFKKNVESGLKVANMGAKTFKWEDGGDNAETKFNYSTDQNAQALWNWFEWMTDSQRAYQKLRLAVRHDKLGVNDALIRVTELWTDQHLVGTPQFLPLFDRVAGDDTYIHLARERAAELAEAVRDWSK